MPDSSSFWAHQRVVVTGGAGFLGSFVTEKLRQKGCESVVVPRRKQFDLRSVEAIDRLLEETTPSLLIHLAASCGGIGANQARPGEFFYDNAAMGIHLIEQARQKGIKKFVQVGTVCAYPKFPPYVPFRESDLWMGYPEETNAPYGLAKKMLLVQLQAYRQQYGFNGIYLLPANLYGPRDNFDLTTSHVIPALIRKCIEAKDLNLSEIEVWGTGKASREFLYVEDAAEGILLAAEKYNEAAPVNLGASSEITIRDLVDMIADVSGYKGQFKWNTTKPDGQPRRALDTEKAKRSFDFSSQTPLRVGLQKTIEWYRSQRLLELTKKS